MRLFLVGVLITFFSFCFSQEVTVDSLLIDTVKVHSPKKAVILSAIVPGAGQVYNHIAMPKGKKKAYWKVPLIYAGLGATGYFLIKNQVTQRDLKLDYTNRINGGIPDPRWELYDDQAILTLYNRYLDWRDLSILGMGVVYLLQLVDAGIEAHFVNFDISEDLSLQIEPAYFGNRTAGISLNFNFR
jgi:hypothetical protein